MAPAMTSSSSATLGIERFTSSFARKVYEQMMPLIQSRSLELYRQTFKTCKFKESKLLFVGLNLNTTVQEKTPETCTFHE